MAISETRTPFPRKPNNQGLTTAAPIVTTTLGGPDLVHTMATVPVRSARITKIMAYNDTGADVTLQFGTLDNNPAGAAFVQLLPTLRALNGYDNEWTEEEIPAVEWMRDLTPTAAGNTGDIYVVASAAGALVTIEIEEFGG